MSSTVNETQTHAAEVSKFIGTWHLVSQHTSYADGHTEPSRGEGARGVLMYDTHGNMTVQLTRTDAQRDSFTDMRDLRTALEGYLAYFGHYEVDTQQHTVTHHVIGASYIGYRGVALVRSYEFSAHELPDDHLTLTATNPADGSLRILVWRRVGTPQTSQRATGMGE